jgi:hypothetical protein
MRLKAPNRDITDAEVSLSLTKKADLLVRKMFVKNISYGGYLSVGH